MNFIWHSALSMFDIGTSLVYTMLGRELTEADVELLRLFFTHMAKSPATVNTKETLAAVYSRLDSDRTQLKNFTALLTSKLTAGIGKDLLLVTSKQTGYNLLQVSLQSSMELASHILSRYYKHFESEKETSTQLEEAFESLMAIRIEFIRVLLDVYTCDPNRGLSLSNKARCVVDVSNGANTNHLSRDHQLSLYRSNYKNGYKTSGNKILGRSKSFNNYVNNTAETTTTATTTAPVTKTSAMATTTTLNVDLKTITSMHLDEAVVAELSATPIDTPLLLLTCVHNCHNLVKSPKKRKTRRKKRGELKNNNGSDSTVNQKKRRHTIHGLTSDQTKAVQLKAAEVVKATTVATTTGVTKKKRSNSRKNSKTDSSVKSDLYSYWSSMSSSNNNNNNNNANNANSINPESNNEASTVINNIRNVSRATAMRNSAPVAVSSTSGATSSEGCSSSSSLYDQMHPMTGDGSSVHELDNDDRGDECAAYGEDQDAVCSLSELDEHARSYGDMNEAHRDSDNESVAGDDDTHNEYDSSEDDEEDDDDSSYLEEEEEEEDDSADSDDDSVTNGESSNIYDYDGVEDNDKLYFEKYDYDVNSMCCRLNSTSDEFLCGGGSGGDHPLTYVTTNPPNYNSDQCINKQLLLRGANNFPKLEANILKVDDQSKQQQNNQQIMKNNLNNCAASSVYTTNNKNNNSNSIWGRKRAFIYAKLNEQRLHMIDLLLEHGADKYLVTKLSVSSLAHVGKRAQLMLRKWYSMTTATIKSADTDSDNDSERQPGELRPLSPIMAALCLDDVDVFARLYKHHHVLFNYFKPDEDYELIYYAIRFQAKRCLVYLLTSTNNETGTVITTTSIKQYQLPGSVSLPNNLNYCHRDCNKETTSVDAAEHNGLTSMPHSQMFLNKNVDTMFYILENTRSSRIVKVLLDCGFDLSRREQRTGNTALHCLFNSSASLAATAGSLSDESSGGKSRRPVSVLGEYHSPRSLSKILFVMLKKGGLKAHVNTLNGARQLSMQALFEWDELVDTVFFQIDESCNYGQEKSSTMRNEWQHEFETCVHLLLKSGADLLLTSHSGDTGDTAEHHHISHNCLSTLFASLLKHSITTSASPASSHQSTRRSSPHSQQHTEHNNGSNLNNSSGSGNGTNRSTSPLLTSVKQKHNQLNESLGVNTSMAHHYHQLSQIDDVDTVAHNVSPPPSPIKLIREQYQRQHVPKKPLDIVFLYHLIAEVCDLSSTVATLTHHHSNHSSVNQLQAPSSTTHTRLRVKESLVDQFIELLLHVSVDNFECALKLFKLLCHVQKQLNSCYHSGTVSTSLLKRLVSQWLLQPTFLCASKQFEKNFFIKSIIVELILCDLYSPNASHHNHHHDEHASLLGHCVQMIFACETVYQMELCYDLLRTLIQYGVQPRLDSADFATNFNTLCTLSKTLTASKTISGHSSPNHHHHHHHHHHHRNAVLKHSATLTALTAELKITDPHEETEEKRPDDLLDQTMIATYHDNHHHHSHHGHHHHHHHHHSHHHRTSNTHTNGRVVASNPILLLTPTPSYASLLTITTNNTATVPLGSITTLHHGHHHHQQQPAVFHPSNNGEENVFVDSTLLFADHYKRFAKLLYDAINDSSTRRGILSSSKPRSESSSSSSTGSHHHHHHHHHYGHKTTTQVYSNNNNNNSNTISRQRSSNNPSPTHSLSPSGSIDHEHQQLIVESLDAHLERLASVPRSLKAICRRHILNRLVAAEKRKKDEENYGLAQSYWSSSNTLNMPLSNGHHHHHDHQIVLISNQIASLPLPKRVKNYLLYAE